MECLRKGDSVEILFSLSDDFSKAGLRIVINLLECLSKILGFQKVVEV